jgi:hypothetical protein
VRANQQMEGQWRLREFTPLSPLDAPVADVLKSQAGALTIRFSRGQFTAIGPGVGAQGRYQITGSEDDEFAAILFDSEGVAHHFTGRLDGSFFRFRSLDAPWEGAGTIERSPG